MRDTYIHDAGNLHKEFRSGLWPAAQVSFGWTVARPEGFSSWQYRIKAAWMVFTGRADALIWPEQ